jgi:Xaa-Pro aminopeptidase
MSIDERFCNPISEAELKRRWAAIRVAMAAQAVDALIIQGAHNLAGNGGYARWFSGLSAPTTKSNVLIFPASGLMTLVCHGAFGGMSSFGGKRVDFPGIDRVRYTPSAAAVGYTGNYEGELAAEEVKAAGFERVGLVGAGNMTYGLLHTLKLRCPHVQFRDFDESVDQIKAVKSPEEIALMRRGAALQDDLLKDACAFIKPGIHDYELMAHSQYMAQCAGAETGYFIGSSAAPGDRTDIRSRQFHGRKLRAGDVVLWQAENTGPGGMFVHMARLIVLGRAPEEIARAYEGMIAAQKFTADRLVPGASSSEVFDAYNAYMVSHGWQKELRIHCHGQGYDVVERPIIRNDETMAIQANMNIGIHPSLATDTMFVTICDNFLVREQGPPERLHKTPQQIFEI